MPRDHEEVSTLDRDEQGLVAEAPRDEVNPLGPRKAWYRGRAQRCRHPVGPRASGDHCGRAADAQARVREGVVELQLVSGRACHRAHVVGAHGAVSDGVVQAGQGEPLRAFGHRVVVHESTGHPRPLEHGRARE